MNKEQKRKLKKKEAFKAQIKTGIIIFFSVILVVFASLAISLFLYTREIGGVSFPESPLTKMMGTHTSYIGNDSLNLKIQCPTIPAILNVGGSERSVSDDGCVFRYDDRLSISIYEVSNSPYDILSTRLAPELYTGEISGEFTYTADANYMDVGYFNGYPAEYQCGIIDVYDVGGEVQKHIYAITICLDLGYDKTLMITTSTTEKKNIYDAEILLESICYTVMDISSTVGTSTKSGQPVEEPVAYTISEEETDIEDEDMGNFLYVEVPLVKEYEDSPYLVFSYTGLEADTSEIVLWDEGKMNSYSPMEESKTGLLFFEMKEGKQSENWNLQLPLSQDFGTYHANVMEKDKFIKQYKEESSSEELEEVSQVEE